MPLYFVKQKNITLYMTKLITTECVVPFKWFVFKREFTFFDKNINNNSKDKTKDHIRS